MSAEELSTLDPRVARTRSEVRDAVLALLRTEGPGAVTHQRVAEAAGVSRATVYRHWEDRSALLLDTLRTLRPAPSDVELTGELRSDLLSLVRAGAAQLHDRPYLPWLVAMLSTHADDPDLGAVMAELATLEGTPLLPLLEAAVARGELRPELDVLVAAAGIVGPLFALRFILGQELTDARLEQVVDAWLHGHQRER